MSMTNINDELDKKISKVLTKYKKNINSGVTNLVLSGGGAKGIAMAGALKELYNNKMLNDIESIAATSAGAIIAGLYCIGYSFDEICKFILKLDVSNVVVPNPANIIDSYALDTGERMEYVLTKMIESKNLNKNITLKEVYNIKKINLIITATCLNDSQIYYNSHITAPDMPLLVCIRMSSAIPIIFKPISYKDKMFIDGGFMDIYPINVFENDMKRTLGILVQDSHVYKPKITDIETFAYSLLECALEGQIYNLIKMYSANTLIITLPQVNLLGGLNTKIKKELYNNGCDAAKQFIKTKL